MRCITITYKYAGDEAVCFNVNLIRFENRSRHPTRAGKFTYPSWTRNRRKCIWRVLFWDSAQTLAHVQSQDYFKTFAPAVRDFAGGAPVATGADVVSKSPDW